ncbi:MAG: DUF2800 domain-containing protein [Pseudomonadota bacterium]
MRWIGERIEMVEAIENVASELKEKHTVEQPAHSIYGASSAERWFSCPGSISLIETLPKRDTESVYAREGSLAHALAETALLAEMAKCPPEWDEDRPVEWDEYPQIDEYLDIEITEEMRDAVDVYLEECNAIRKMSSVSGVETRFDLTASLAGYRLPEKARMFGTCDFWAYVPGEKTLYVRDYKHGKGVSVAIENNKQQLYYALGAADALAQEGLLSECGWVDLGIVQPRTGGEPVKRWRILLSDLYAFEAELVAAVEATVQESAQFAAGDHCRFCPALGVCETARDKARAVAKTEFSNVEDLGPVMKTLSSAELAKILDDADFVAMWVEAVRTEASRRLSTGKSIPGWKLVQKRAQRKWDESMDAGTLGDLLADEYPDLSVDQDDVEVVERKLLSPAKLETFLSKRLDLPKAEIKTFVSSIAVSESSGTTMAREEDSRLEVKSGPQQDFSAV